MERFKEFFDKDMIEVGCAAFGSITVSLSSAEAIVRIGVGVATIIYISTKVYALIRKRVDK